MLITLVQIYVLYDCKKWHAHLCTILCFLSVKAVQAVWRTVQTTLFHCYWHSYLSTEVNLFTPGTQNGTMATKQKKLESFTLDAMAIHLGLHRTQFHLSSNSMKEHYFPRKYLCCSISLRLSNSTICAWPQCLCCAYFQKPRYPSLPWLFSVMHHLVSPTYKCVQRMSKAR